MADQDPDISYEDLAGLVIREKTKKYQENHPFPPQQWAGAAPSWRVGEMSTTATSSPQATYMSAATLTNND